MSWSQVEIVELLLLKRRRNLATAVDCNGRTPLHLLLASPDDIGEPTLSKTLPSLSSSSVMHCRMMSFHRVLPLQSIVQLLVHAAPDTLNLEDSNEMSPIELATLSNPVTQLQTIQKMRKRSEKQWKKNQVSATGDKDAHRGSQLSYSSAHAIHVGEASNGHASRSTSIDTCKTIACTTDDEHDDDESMSKLSTLY